MAIVGVPGGVDVPGIAWDMTRAPAVAAAAEAQTHSEGSGSGSNDQGCLATAVMCAFLMNAKFTCR